MVLRDTGRHPSPATRRRGLKVCPHRLYILCSRTWVYLLGVIVLTATLLYLYKAHGRQAIVPTVRTLTPKVVTRMTVSRDVPEIETEDNVTKVLIVSYMRSGTSLLGKLFDENDEALYIFEPMWYLCILAVPGFKQISFLNGTKLYAPPSCTSIGLRETEFYLTCRIDEITKGSLSQFWMQSARKTNTFYRCGLEPDCVEEFTEVCQQSPVRAVKVINLRLDDVKPLLTKHRDLRIIHLVRDPRGMIQSRIPMKEYYYYSPVITGASLCGDMLRDARAFARLTAQYPHQLLRIRYEDFAESPLAYSEKIYWFLGSQLPDKVKHWILENTNSHAQDSWSLGTARANSSLTSYKWRQNITWGLTLSMDKACSRVYKALGYLKAKSEKMLRNTNVPLKVKVTT